MNKFIVNYNWDFHIKVEQESGRDVWSITGNTLNTLHFYRFEELKAYLLDVGKKRTITLSDRIENLKAELIIVEEAILRLEKITEDGIKSV